MHSLTHSLHAFGSHSNAAGGLGSMTPNGHALRTVAPDTHKLEERSSGADEVAQAVGQPLIDALNANQPWEASQGAFVPADADKGLRWLGHAAHSARARRLRSVESVTVSTRTISPWQSDLLAPFRVTVTGVPDNYTSIALPIGKVLWKIDNAYYPIKNIAEDPDRDAETAIIYRLDNPRQAGVPVFRDRGKEQYQPDLAAYALPSRPPSYRPNAKGLYEADQGTYIVLRDRCYAVRGDHDEGFEIYDRTRPDDVEGVPVRYNKEKNQWKFHLTGQRDESPGIRGKELHVLANGQVVQIEHDIWKRLDKTSLLRRLHNVLEIQSWTSPTEAKRKDALFLQSYRDAFERLSVQQRSALSRWASSKPDPDHAEVGLGRVLNYYQRGQLVATPQLEHQYRALVRALKKMPTPAAETVVLFPTTLQKPLGHTFFPGDVITFSPFFAEAFSDGATALKAQHGVDKNWHHGGDTGSHRVRFLIRGHSARMVDSGEHPMWLIPPGTTYKVELSSSVRLLSSSSADGRNTIRIIQLKEVTPTREAKYAFTGKEIADTDYLSKWPDSYPYRSHDKRLAARYPALKTQYDNPSLERYAFDMKAIDSSRRHSADTVFDKVFLGPAVRSSVTPQTTSREDYQRLVKRVAPLFDKAYARSPTFRRLMNYGLDSAGGQPFLRMGLGRLENAEAYYDAQQCAVIFQPKLLSFVLNPNDPASVAFKNAYDQVILHEIIHGVGPDDTFTGPYKHPRGETVEYTNIVSTEMSGGRACPVEVYGTEGSTALRCLTSPPPTSASYRTTLSAMPGR